MAVSSPQPQLPTRSETDWRKQGGSVLGTARLSCLVKGHSQPLSPLAAHSRAPPLRPSAPPFQLPCACLKHKGKSTAILLPHPGQPSDVPFKLPSQKRHRKTVNVEAVPGPSGGVWARRALWPPRPGSAQGGWSRAQNLAPGSAGAAEGHCRLASLQPLRAGATRGLSASSSPEASPRSQRWSLLRVRVVGSTPNWGWGCSRVGFRLGLESGVKLSRSGLELEAALRLSRFRWIVIVLSRYLSSMTRSCV